MGKFALLTALLSLLGRSSGFATELCSHDEVVDSIKNNIRCEMMIVQDLLDSNIMNRVNLSSNDPALELLKTLEPSLLLNTGAKFFECAAVAVTCLRPGFWQKIPKETGLNVRNMISRMGMGENSDEDEDKDENGLFIQFDKGNDCIDDFENIKKEVNREGGKCLDKTVQFMSNRMSSLQAEVNNDDLTAHITNDVCSQIEKDVKCAVDVRVSCLSERENKGMIEIAYQIRDHALDVKTQVTDQTWNMLSTLSDFTRDPDELDSFKASFDFYEKMTTCGLGSSTSTNKDYTFEKSFDSLMLVTNSATKARRDPIMISVFSSALVILISSMF